MGKINRKRWTWTAYVAVLLACSTAVAGYALAAGAPWVLDRLGPASPELGVVERTGLTLYLAASLAALDAPAGNAEAALELEVSPGQHAGDVVEGLRAAGIVRNPSLLLRYLRYRGLDRTVEAGRHSLSGAMSVRDIAEAMQSARDPSRTVTVVEGWRREETAEALAAAGVPIDPAGFVEWTSQGNLYLDGLPSGATLEGFLFPDTYSLAADATLPEVVQGFVDNFEARVGADIRSGFEVQRLTLFEAVTLASIIEREAAVPDERASIASVFLNRLRLGMRLEADPTVQFALGRQPPGSWWKSPLTFEDLQIDSAYNTYQFPGLPPGPIASPGLASLQAVAFPADTEFLFFRAACDGSGRHEFSRTLEEHLARACP